MAKVSNFSFGILRFETSLFISLLNNNSIKIKKYFKCDGKIVNEEAKSKTTFDQ